MLVEPMASAGNAVLEVTRGDGRTVTVGWIPERRSTIVPLREDRIADDMSMFWKPWEKTTAEDRRLEKEVCKEFEPGPIPPDQCFVTKNRLTQWLTGRHTTFPADHTISIPAFDPVNEQDAGKPVWALNAQRIANHWRQFVLAHPPARVRAIVAGNNPYHAHITVAAALVAGGLRLYGDPPECWVSLNSSTALAKWVTEAIATMTIMNRHADFLRPELRAVQVEKGTVPTPDEWKKMSSLLIGKRTEHVATIDEYLPRYHAAAAAGAAKEADRMIGAMVRVAYDHLLKKPKSDRRKAMLQLVRRLTPAARSGVHAATPNAPVPAPGGKAR